MSTIRCFFGVHQWDTIETKEDINQRGDTVGEFYIQQCKICGKIKADHIRFY